MRRTAVINVVGLTQSCLGPATPRLSQFAKAGSLTPVVPALPAVTCTAQANYLTGQMPSRHGIVANGWYNRDLAEVHFWKQSNRLVQSQKLWEELRQLQPGFTCANLFWWYNMYSTADYSITPRPMYPADGRKFFDIYAWPYSIRTEVKEQLGEFPFPCFWGPAAGIDSPQGKADAVSRWIAESAKWIEQRYHPSLSLIYLPHLDYNFQRLGPADPQLQRDLQQIDDIVGDLIAFFRERSVQAVVLSEYGITAVDRAIHLNRVFRERNWLTIKTERGLEVLDYGASKVFAVADHQIAHIYLQEPAVASEARALIESQPGVAEVLDAPGRARTGLDHSRAGDLVALADERSWFTYYYWLDDAIAPDFARTVDIHRKPGYDPVELFLDPDQRWIKAKILFRLAQKKLGFRMLMDVIPLDAGLVKGSHGVRPRDPAHWPIFVAERSVWEKPNPNSPQVYDFIKRLALE